ncbi:MAG: phosphatase PAP2 family protein [Eubacteriales bacterium]|nr:phosphatase PAP2 family protein [Eubacteriales bacterium]
MRLPQPETDLRGFRPRKIREAQYRHLCWLLFWPAYMLRYLIVENCNPAESYHVMHCFLDDKIPFCEIFLVFYVCWYVFIAGMHLYTLLFDVDTFRRYSKFLCISMGISSVIFLVYPSCQNLRPETLPRDNALSRVVAFLYSVDTPTNVFPSEHVIGSIAALIAAAHTERLRKPGRLAILTVLTVLICVSTLFLKQHSALDVLGALPICIISYLLCYEKRGYHEHLSCRYRYRLHNRKTGYSQ